MPEQVNYPEVIADVVARLVSGDRAGADRSMADIAYPKREMTKRLPRSASMAISSPYSYTAIKNLPEPTTQRYELIAALLAVSAATFMVAKIIQVILWRVGSFAIRHGIYARLEALNGTTVPGQRETD